MDTRKKTILDQKYDIKTINKDDENVLPIISVSRRSDIPAYYAEKFLKDVKRGFILFKNPFNFQRLKVDIKPDKISAFVFWSKNYRPFMKALEKINELYTGRFILHFTINNYKGKAKNILEPNIPGSLEMIELAKELSEKYGKEKLSIRYDPIIISNLTPLSERLESFEEIIENLNGYILRIYVSFVDIYKKVSRRFLKNENRIKITEPTVEEKASLLSRMKNAASKKNIKILTCCEDQVGQMAGIEKGHCIDVNILKKLFPDVPFTNEIRPTRNECGCYYSIDIGEYNTCKSKCLYCYANR